VAKRSAAARACGLIQLYVRLLETDENGYGYCCSCGKSLVWAECQGGHFHPKGNSYNAAAFEEENVHVQCASCNLFQKGNPSGYLTYMNKEYGEWDESNQEFSNPVVEHINSLIGTYLEIEEVRDIARIYKQKCKDLSKYKNFQVRIPT
jgi:hypothetical protein